ncbi:hypothetical protein DOY81_011323 [Sarcophaga bullata]|nr:hypothetical protein DOY81_011323 [Sarcophaga bullata]
MALEGELPEELDKLEITPIMPQVKLLDSNLPVQLNPFFENDLKNTNVDVKSEHATGTTTPASPISTIISRPATNCRRCRYRRASESVLDELKYVSSTTVASETPDYSRTPPNGVLKQTLKKSTTSSVGGPGNRKKLLREPVLKALQTCLHPHSNARRNLNSSAVPNMAANGHNDGPLVTKEEVDFTGRLNQMSLSSRNSKNFTTMQSPKTGNSNKLSKNRRPISNALSTPSSLSSSSISFEEHHRHHHLNGTSVIQPPLLGNSINSTSNLQQRNSNNVSPEHARCSTTCSQQAGNSVSAATACDDVTIDELASYFDTFVHIPKKMSSMAEMMYI